VARKAKTSRPVAGSLARRHFRIGWVALCAFVVLGGVLDAFHAFKLGFYLDVGTETRRLMWTLAHAHGVGISLMHLGFGATLASLFEEVPAPLELASSCFSWATLLMPLGFFLGGIGTLGGDPGIGIFLVPVGALVLLLGVFLAARETLRSEGAAKR